MRRPLLNVTSDDLWQEILLTQRRKENPENAVALCAFAPLREKSSSHQALLVQSRDRLIRIYLGVEIAINTGAT